MRIPLYQVDAFSDKPFGGNPAAVCILESWLDDALLQAIAAENNLSETAFIVKNNDGYDIRWFTPAVEIDLCGHATLASAYVVHALLEPTEAEVRFNSPLSGPLPVTCADDLFLMNFPARPAEPIEPPDGLGAALGARVCETFAGRDLLVVLESEESVANLKPDILRLKSCAEFFAVMVTAKGNEVDFVSRFFAPRAGIDEDPVTGSAHATLIPFWGKRLGKTHMTARQLSQRGGELVCEHRGDRVIIGGHAALFLQGEICI